MKNLYVVDTDRWVRAECETLPRAKSQAREYVDNYWWYADIYNYYIENPDITYQVVDSEIEFYIDDNPIYQDEREDYWLWRCLIKTID